MLNTVREEIVEVNMLELQAIDEVPEIKLSDLDADEKGYAPGNATDVYV